MKKILLSIVAALGLMAGSVHAAGGTMPLDKAPDRINDMGALQNGAKLFVNYCIGCHSAAFMRYNRLTDIGLTEGQIKENLLFSTDKIGDTMKSAIDPKQAKEWFGANPPDLTVIARSRAGLGGTGSDYLYTFLRTFYPDEAKATGWNNLVFPSVGMPHALWQLQGERRAIFETQAGHTAPVFTGWEQIAPGTMTPEQYDEAIGDLVGYLQWMGEPVQSRRVQMGIWVLVFLAFTTVLAWKLNASFWKDVK